jgi:SAM-dependent methyltransferase
LTNNKTADDWTLEPVKRLWHWASTTAFAQNLYFTSNVGAGLVKFLHSSGRLRGRVLDYGCGAGHLIGHLLARELVCYGVDASADSVAAVNAKYRSRANWGGALVTDGQNVPFTANAFDFVTFIETIEHLPRELLSPTLSEIYRVMRPGATLCVTTPHAEDLNVEQVYCPFCDSAFHRWQHMRSWTIAELRDWLETGGLQVNFCRNMDFDQFQVEEKLPQRWDNVTWNQVRRYTARRVRQELDHRFPRPFPNARETQFRLGAGHGRHLCALAVKR